MSTIVTTSWDDGHLLDRKLVELLRKYDMPATFYLAPRNREFGASEIMGEADMRALAADFEVGSHTMTHPVLTTISMDDVAKELAESRQYLQNLTGQPVTSFCYPRGIYSPDMLPLVRDAGYTYARTVALYELGKPTDLLQAGTTTEAHRFGIPTLPRELPQLWQHVGMNPRNLTWKHRAMALFDQAMTQGGVFHLWGHSWVVERENKWRQLEEVLDYIHGRTDVHYQTNGQLAAEAASA